MSIDSSGAVTIIDDASIKHNWPECRWKWYNWTSGGVFLRY